MPSASCRICSTPLSPFMSFGRMPIANGFLRPEDFADEYFFELAPAFCDICKMFQIVEQPDPSRMFHENYAFFSSTSQKMAEHFQAMALHYQKDFLSETTDPFVVELGSNDGIMLRHFAAKGVRHLGVEPSANVAEVARQKGIQTISQFFGEKTAQEIAREQRQADIITASNVMCHIPDLHSVAKGVKHLLKPQGVFVFEDPYLGDVIQKTSYDQIYDSHVYLFSVESVGHAFQSHGLTLFHVEPQVTHGGSMRYYLCHEGAYPVRDSVKTQLNLETELRLEEPETYQTFRKSCEKNRDDLVKLLKDFKSQDKRVAGYAAAAKSTVVLNYCGIGPDLVSYISDNTPIKQGMYSPGMHIPVKSPDVFHEDHPDYALLFAWNHASEVFEKETSFEERGGQWIVFVPEVRVLEKSRRFL